MKVQFTILAIFASADTARAFQTSSRRDFISNAVATAAAGTLLPASASAKERKASKRELLRGGKERSDALHNGTDLNAKESEMASGLLEKMSVPDITADKGPSSRAPPKR
ncbi:hypothetical protein THAOC_15226 [Thalassiosira oceanica]|uniref:RxLR effector protein n=1 Tax=Thalassiosira oceanica TaxID=159749 RepID=K0SFD0_THAOC|nr:hypothetical protein THAOC_15226 [Thalassiosira oceanica]|eukprot:EJK64075.1 hypothetical protein THAOC_15226 [Thalassiosira oceanica]